MKVLKAADRVKLLELAHRATKGSWYANIGPRKAHWISVAGGPIGPEGSIGSFIQFDDVLFAAHAKNVAVPLLDALRDAENRAEKAEAEVARLKAMVEKQAEVLDEDDLEEG